MKYLDTLRDKFEELELDYYKAMDWFDDHPFAIDVKLAEYDESVAVLWYTKVFSEDISCTQMKINAKKLGNKDILEVLSHYFRRTCIGMLRYCIESQDTWMDTVHKDNVWRITWFHHVIANEIDGAFEEWINGDSGRFILLSIPPQHLKSTFFSGGLVPMIMGNYSHIRGIITSYNDDYAETILSKDAMSIIGTKGYTELFGRRFNKNLSKEDKIKLKELHKSPPKDSSDRKDTTENGSIYAASLGKITGNPAEFLVVDDPIKNAEQATSPTVLQKICDEYDASALSRVRDRTIVCIAQTRWSNNDIIGYTLKKMEEVKKSGGKFGREVVNICLRAFYDSTDDFAYDFRTYDEQPLWPQISSDAYALAKVGSSLKYNAVYQQRPIDNLTNYVKEEWLVRFDNPPENFKSIFISVDTSNNDKVTSDKAGIGVWGVTAHQHYYLIDLFFDRCGFTQLLREIRTMVAKYPNYTALLIEAKTAGESAIDTLEQELPAVVSIKANESKLSRLLSCTPVLEQCRVHVPNGFVGDKVVSQMVTFRGVGKKEKDELVDITTQVIRYVDSQFRAVIDMKDIRTFDKTKYNLPGDGNKRYTTPVGSKINRLRGL